MNVKILETGEVKALHIYTRDGIDWIYDLIGNANSRESFVWREEEDAFFATQDNYDFWARYIEDTYATEREAEELADELGISFNDVMLRVEDYQDCDYTAHRYQAKLALSHIREEYTV